MRTKRTKKLALTLAAILLFCAALPPFAALADPKATWPVFLMGDVDMDGVVSSADARLALRAAVGLEQYNLYSYSASAADADRDGEIASADARIILRTAVGLETSPVGIRESCSLFTVTLPAFWKGKYTVEKTADTLRFYYKPAKAAGETGFLFSISAMTLENAKESFGFGDLACTLEGTEPERFVVVGYPSDMPVAMDQIPDYQTMAVNAAAVAGTLEPAAWYVSPTYPDYSGLKKQYYGSPYGMDLAFGLTITEVNRNYIDAVISYESSAGFGEISADAMFIMYGDEGIVSWSYQNNYFLGTVRIIGNALEVNLKGDPGTWADLDVPITFTPNWEYLDLDEINSHELTAEESGEVLKMLRGVWLNDLGDYTIGFVQEGGDPEFDPVWSMFCGVPNAGADWSGVVQTPLYGDPNGIVRVPTVQPEYTDADGVYHPAMELNFYVDLHLRNDNSISWTNDGTEWDHCYFSALDPGYIEELDSYTEILSQNETDDLMDSLRGVWMNYERTYFLAFCQVDSDTWEASFAPPFSEYDFSGTTSRKVFRNPQGLIRMAVTGTDLNGYPVDIDLYLDLSRKMDNTVLWSTDGYEWETCSFFCLGVEQIPDRMS